MSAYDGLCLYCRAPILYLVDPYVQTVLEVEWAPNKDGYVKVDLERGHATVVPVKVMKKYKNLHLPHIAKCTAYETRPNPPDRLIRPKKEVARKR